MLHALIFDFDGVVLDTETPLFSAWELTFEHFGASPIELEEWVVSIGLREDDPARLDPLARLQESLGSAIDASHVQAVRRQFRDALLDSSPLRPGVEDLLHRCKELGIAVAIASSSPAEWIERHLGPRGFLHWFPVRSYAGGDLPGKPHPAVYLNAAEALDVDAASCLSIEDSVHGVASAVAAGIRCVAAPTPGNRIVGLRTCPRSGDEPRG